MANDLLSTGTAKFLAVEGASGGRVGDAGLD